MRAIANEVALLRHWALGIGAADLVLTAFTAVIAQWPPSFDLIRTAGAVYLLWMAYQVIRSPGVLPAHSAVQASLHSVFLRAMLNSLLNPKALLFFMVFLPQFVDRDTPQVTQQLVWLGVVLTLIAVAFHAALGMLGGAIRRLVSSDSGFGRWQSRGMATVLVLLAVRLALTSRPS